MSRLGVDRLVRWGLGRRVVPAHTRWVAPAAEGTDRAGTNLGRSRPVLGRLWPVGVHSTGRPVHMPGPGVFAHRPGRSLCVEVPFVIRSPIPARRGYRFVRQFPQEVLDLSPGMGESVLAASGVGGSL